MQPSKRETLESKLLKSQSVQSLRFEQEIRQLLQRDGWEATQSAYYVDATEKKVRETDVIATRGWQRTLAKERQRVQLHISKRRMPTLHTY